MGRKPGPLIQCKTCQGSGNVEQPCNFCQGTGGPVVISCPECKYVENGQQCHACYGDEEIEVDNCPKCGGAAFQEVSCASCQGTGQIDNPSYTG